MKASILYRVTTQLKYQLPLAMILVGIFATCIWLPQITHVDLKSLDRATFITALGSVASILALFCSLSIAWILFVSQQDKSERITAYDLLKNRLLETQKWLLGQPVSEHRETCLSLTFEFDKLDISDIPQTDWGDEYRAYTEALDVGLESDEPETRKFYLTSIFYFGYIEHLLSRIGIISIRQVMGKIFIDTFAKGLTLLTFAILTVISATLWYGDKTKDWFFLAVCFTGIGSALLLLEVWTDLRRYYNEEIDFIEKSDSENEKT